MPHGSWLSGDARQRVSTSAGGTSIARPRPAQREEQGHCVVNSPPPHDPAGEPEDAAGDFHAAADLPLRPLMRPQTQPGARRLQQEPDAPSNQRNGLAHRAGAGPSLPDQEAEGVLSSGYLLCPGRGGGGGLALVVGSNLPPFLGSYVSFLGSAMVIPLTSRTTVHGIGRTHR